MEFENKNNIENLYEKHKEEVYELTEEEKQLIDKEAEIEEKLRNTMTEEQRKILEEYNEIEKQRKERLTKHTFTFAYSLANKLLIESLFKDK